MDLKSGYPFWAIKNGLMCAFPQLQADIHCDVVVVGGGITGSLIADELATHGFDTVVVEQRDIGWGSSAASTALLQYEIDTHMVDLATMYGETQAVLAYKACAAAITDIGKLANELGDVDFSIQHSLYYASKGKDKAALREEYLLRKKHQFAMQWLDAGSVKEQFGIKAPCAILSKQAGSVDPYRMASRLLLRLAERGGRVFDRTVIASIKPTADKVTLRTLEGHQIHTKHVVMAAGYASQKWLKQSVAKNRSSYAFITDPMAAEDLGWLASTMAWESARPYLYMRTTGDNRLLVGGDDDDIDIPARRDKRVESKAKGLVKKVEKLLPQLSLRPAFSWAGTFAETEDGLPFFGEHQQWGPRVLFAMAYGGNGISYSMIGAGLLRATIEGRSHPLAPLFGFSRLS
ncbi:glycine/D-amino acid oxidase-like deaminating enzyme [Rheinheimera pacifica]|uniref:NAD(P)/FAD-dependent oxidoreductase n=1 Tax=Rheinheimera pacifica TaxID=173990 RepID=UPI00285B24F0|nr:FAD-dependent oxidoreductase [Rheinheimera pacifica]MDR6982260.1 glycine/D-amino acid oxidase-like deaminating enzyme [Rheinheimera pacifica]